MKIAFGISSLKKSLLRSYIKAGVDEFFTGYINKEWINTFGWEVSVNRRQWPGASFTTLKELGEVAGMIHEYGKKIFLTINEHDYSEKEMDLVLKTIRELQPVPIDAFIISSLPLMIKLRNKGIKTPFHVSIGGGCNNFEVVRFYKKNIENITRYILPRKLTIEEITHIAQAAKNEGVELEIFGMSEQCMWNDEYCFSWHSKSCENLCFYTRKTSQLKLVYPVKDWKKDVLKKGAVLKKFRQLATHANSELEMFPMKQNPDYGLTELYNRVPFGPCGLCAIPIFDKIGIYSFKVPGRGKMMDLETIGLVKKILNRTDPAPLHTQNIFGAKELCRGQNCYYNFPFN